jgi:hypothetical protein
VGNKKEIKKGKIIKEIISIGKWKICPSDFDTVLITIKTYILKDNEKVYINELSFDEKETDLDTNELPKAIRLAIMEMKEGEIALISIKDNYLLHHFKKNNKEIPKQLGSEFDFIYCETVLHKFYITQNLIDRGEIKKKIIHNGKGWKYAKLSDTITFNLTCYHEDKLLYEKLKQTVALDSADLYEIELRILQNIKIGEISHITVKPSWLREKNQQFLKDYNIDFPKELSNDDLNKAFKCVIFHCEMLDIDNYEYIFKADKDKISKKKILQKGFGKDTPDRESFVAVNLMIKLDGKVIYNDFENENIGNLERYEQYGQWREDINKEYNIENIDDEDDYSRDKEIFKKFKAAFKGVSVIDLRHYSIPIILRKVLIHMKRNEIAYVKTNFLDSLCLNNVELNNISGNVEVYIHLYEYLHRISFMKLTYEEKLEDLSEMKELANNFYKEGKLFRACKIYQNINSRFTYGDVFNSIVNMEEAERKAKEEHRELYNKLVDIRLSCHSNLANAKFRQKKFASAYNISNRVSLFFL